MEFSYYALDREFTALMSNSHRWVGAPLLSHAPHEARVLFMTEKYSED